MAVSGIEKTLRTLLRSTNPAATELLISGLSSEDVTVRQGAVRAIALREAFAGHRELVQRFERLPIDAQSALSDVATDAPLSTALPRLLEASAPETRLAAAKVADHWGDADALAAIVNAALRDGSAQADELAPMILRLAGRMDARIVAYRSALEAGKTHHDPVFARRAAINALAPAVRRFAEHGRGELIEAFLMLAPPDEPVLEACLADEEHPAFEEITAQLQTTTHANALAILSRSLSDSRAGERFRSIAAARTDAVAMSALYARLGDPIGSVARETCGKVESFAWLEPDRLGVLLEITEDAQAAAIQVAAASADSRRKVAEAVILLLKGGAPKGRCAACRAIANLPSHVAIEPLRVALQSDDAAVLAVAAKLASTKQYPHATAELVRLAKHGSEPVQKAAQKSLQGVSYNRFRDHADALSDDDRQRVGSLVGQADPTAPATLRAELKAGAIARRLKAMEMIELTGLAETLTPDLIERASDTDAGVRAEALRLLSTAPPSEEIQKAFEAALDDANPSVRAQAAESLATSELQAAKP